MSSPPKPQSWWHTLPGVLTTIAGVITGVAAILAALQAAGLLGTAKKDVDKPRVEIAMPAEKAPDQLQTPDPSIAVAAKMAGKWHPAGDTTSDYVVIASGRNVTMTEFQRSGGFAISTTKGVMNDGVFEGETWLEKSTIVPERGMLGTLQLQLSADGQKLNGSFRFTSGRVIQVEWIRE